MKYSGSRFSQLGPSDDLLSDIWGDAADVASNVVDVVVRSLCKKPGEQAHVIETMSGIGYRRAIKAFCARRCKLDSQP